MTQENPRYNRKDLSERDRRCLNLYLQKREVRASENRNKKSSAKELEIELKEKIRLSKAFSWYGFIHGLDDNGSATVFNLHFLRRPDTNLSEETEVEIVILYEDLALTMGADPAYIPFTNRPEYTPERFKEALIAGYAVSNGKWVLVFDEFLSRTNA